MLQDTRSDGAAIRIDLAAERVWRDGSPLSLRPKTWAVLRCLVLRPGLLVTKEELMDAVWADTAVSEGTLNKSIGELRALLGDDREQPRYIETVSRRGFRWVGGESITGAITNGHGAVAAPDGHDATAVAVATAVATAVAMTVGRERELAALQRCFETAATGTRQIVFLTGEAGAGKSTLVDAFLSRIGAPVTTAHGQCIEAYGQHEPYRPLLEATERLVSRSDVGATALAVLRSKAPTWLRQLPSGAGAEAAPDGDAGMAPARMLREIASALEEIASDRPLVLVLEDLHWADLATIDACNLIARRRDPARLLVIATLRSADALVSRHPALPLKGDLVGRGLAAELPVDLFTPEVIGDYLELRCSGLQADAELVAWIHRQTAGNPLFVSIVVDDLVQRGVLAREDERWRLCESVAGLRDVVPESLREIIESQVDRLSADERAIIEAACALRTDFDASSVASLAGADLEKAEEICETLARRGQMLRHARHGGSMAATRGSRYSFVHSMVQRSLHDRLPPSRRRRLHLAAARHIEQTHDSREDLATVDLALHFALAGEPASALAQLQRAAASVQRIPAPREVIVIREQILDLVENSPGLPGHRRELVVAVMELAKARQLAFAVVDAECAALCERVVELAVTAEDGRECFEASMGLFSRRFYTGRYQEACDIGRRLLVAAQMYQHPFMTKSAHFAIAGAAYRLGQFDEASTHFEACLEHSVDSQQTYGWDFHLMSMSHLALVASHRGQPEEARRLVLDAEAYGGRNGGPVDAAVIPLFAFALALIGDDDAAMLRVKRALAQSERIGAAAWIERARFVYGLLLSRQGQVEEGIRGMQESLARQARNNILLDRSAYCALLAGELHRQRIAGADAVVREGIAFLERSGERHFEPELRRLAAVAG